MRFISADTIVPSASDPQQLNRYAYARGNPLKYVDPTGHRAIECEDGDGGCTYGTKHRPTSGQKKTLASRVAMTGDTEPLRPDIFVVGAGASQQDIDKVWNLLEQAKGYGPRTRELIQGYEDLAREFEMSGWDMKITIIRDQDLVEANFENGIIDIGDVEKFPGYGPLPPSSVLLHEFVEQSVKQIWGLPSDQLGYKVAHARAVWVENVANTERFGYPVTKSDDIPIFNGVKMAYRFSAPEYCGITYVSMVSSIKNPFSVSVSGAQMP